MQKYLYVVDILKVSLPFPKMKHLYFQKPLF